MRIAPSANGSSSSQAKEKPPVEPPQEQDAECNRKDHDESAKVRLDQQQSTDADHDGEQRQEAADQAFASAAAPACQEHGAAHGVAGRIQDDDQAS